MIEFVSGNVMFVYILALIFFFWAFLRNLKKFKIAKARKEKILKNYYFRATWVSVLILGTIILGLFNRVLLSLILFFILVIISLLLLPSTLKARRVENEKILAKLHRQDLALIDFLTHRGWLKLAQKFGCWNSAIIVFMISLILLFMILAGVDFLAYGEIGVVRVMSGSLVISGFLSAFFYLTVKKTHDQVIFWGK